MKCTLTELVQTLKIVYTKCQAERVSISCYFFQSTSVYGGHRYVLSTPVPLVVDDEQASHRRCDGALR